MTFLGFEPIYYVTYGRRVNEESCNEIALEARAHSLKIVEFLNTID